MAACILVLLQFAQQFEILKMSFPKDFVWGAATSSYQIEGGWDADGKGPSIWDTMTHEHPEKVNNGDNGDIACNSYNMINDDLKIMKELGISSYRFSISWPRIMPNGTKSNINKDGLAYYSELIDGLLKIGVQPAVTMYHWDLPQRLQDTGGWTNSTSIKHFTDYADVLYENFGDRVKMWITFNEPWVSCVMGYQDGVHAPNIIDRDADMYRAAHNIILAHAAAYRLYSQKYRERQKGKVGITLNSSWYFAKDEKNQTHVEAAERALMFKLGWFAQPIFQDGCYPEAMVARVSKSSEEEGLEKSKLPEFSEEERALIRHSADFLGLNYYSSNLCSPLSDSTAKGYFKHRHVHAEKDKKWPETTLPWLSLCPSGLRHILKYIDMSFNKIPVYITENGTTDMSGTLDDEHRVTYYTLHLEQVLKAILEDGCNVKGYFAWSLMDNFEWSEGYAQKFGLYFVDFTDPQRSRVAKSSAKFYANVIKRGKLL